MIFLSYLVKNSIYSVPVIRKLAMKWYLMRMCASWLCPFITAAKWLRMHARLFYCSIPLMAIDKFRISPQVFAHMFTFWRLCLVLLTVIWESITSNYDADLLSRHGAVSWSVSSRHLIRRQIKHNRRHKLKRGPIRPKGQANKELREYAPPESFESVGVLVLRWFPGKRTRHRFSMKLGM